MRICATTSQQLLQAFVNVYLYPFLESVDTIIGYDLSRRPYTRSSTSNKFHPKRSTHVGDSCAVSNLSMLSFFITVAQLRIKIVSCYCALLSCWICSPCAISRIDLTEEFMDLRCEFLLFTNTTISMSTHPEDAKGIGLR